MSRASQQFQWNNSRRSFRTERAGLSNSLVVSVRFVVPGRLLSPAAYLLELRDEFLGDGSRVIWWRQKFSEERRRMMEAPAPSGVGPRWYEPSNHVAAALLVHLLPTLHHRVR